MAATLKARMDTDDLYRLIKNCFSIYDLTDRGKNAIDAPHTPLMQIQHNIEERWQDVVNLIHFPNNHSSSTFSETAATPAESLSNMHTTNHSNVTSYLPSTNVLNTVLIENATLPMALGPLSPNINTNVIDQSSFANAVSNSLSTLTNGSDPATDGSQMNFNFDNSLFPLGLNQTNQSSNYQAGGIFSGLINETEYDLLGMTINERESINDFNHTGNKIDVSSDSAVSSVTSEYLSSLTDREWLDSSSSETSQDLHDRLYSSNTSVSEGVFEDSSALSSNMSEVSDPKYYTFSNADRIPLAQKKYKFFGKHMQEESPNVLPNNSRNEDNRDISFISFSGPSQNGGYASQYFDIQGDSSEGAVAMASPTETKPTMHSFLNQYDQIQTNPSNYVRHNHTYNMPPENDDGTSDPTCRDKLTRKQIQGDKGLSRDERRAKEMNISISIEDIVNLSMDEFNELISKFDFSETQLTLIRDIRRRGKNKVAAQNCRKRKIDQIFTLEDELQHLQHQKMQVMQKKESMKRERELSVFSFQQVYDKVFKSLLVRKQQQLTIGQPLLNPEDFSLQITPEGNVYLAPSTASNMSDFHKFQPHGRK
ncbi:Segmentation protein cap'n'collar [Nymphon striatum]|nr:Segmentation protein cap'n'collar [Nymphon striatum]KAG1687997.1 Segmentation protein cap'n'collar [Nymphon striatum]